MNEIARRLLEGVDEAVENYRSGTVNKSGEPNYSQSDIDKTSVDNIKYTQGGESNDRLGQTLSDALQRSAGRNGNTEHTYSVDKKERRGRKITVSGRTAEVLSSSGETAEQKRIRQQLKAEEGRDMYFTTDGTYFLTDSAVFMPADIFEDDGFTLSDRQASFSEDRFNDLVSSYSVKNGGAGSQSNSNDYVAYISPSDFLALTTTQEEFIVKEARDNYFKLDVNTLKNERNTPFLKLDLQTGEVTGHEGRHRMVLLRDAGIEKVAIVIEADSEAGKYNAQKLTNFKISGQELKSGKAPGMVVLDEVIPLSPKYRNEVKEKFVDVGSDIKYSVSDSDGNELSREQQDFFKNVDNSLRAEQGRLKPFYHGTSRADRVGYYFDPERATSGPMAFFTDNKQIADNYAQSKADTSLAYDSDYDSYETQFRVNVNGKSIPVTSLWGYLTSTQKNAITQKAQQLTMDDDYENFVLKPENKYGNGGFDLRYAKGNAIQALIDSWLYGGYFVGEEENFLDVLKAVGINDAEYKDPNYREEKTYKTYLNITNPFNTDWLDEEFIDDLKDYVENTDMSIYEKESADADMWDKNNIDILKWIDRLQEDFENGTTFSWTSIPDVVTDFLKEYGGYDGIIDRGGKQGGEIHTVAIPFYSNQIKDVTNKNPTDDPDIRYSESDIDKFTERTYNNYGWVSVNDVLSSQALRRMYSQFASIKTGVHYDKTIDGYYIIPTGDYDKVLNNFVYIKGTVKNPVIKQIIKLNLQSESEIYIAGMWLDEIRRYGLEQSERARKAIVDSYGEGSARICLPDDFKSFRDQIRSRKAGNLQANKRNTRAEQDGGRNDSKNQGRSEVVLSDEVKTSISDAGMRLTDNTELSSLMRKNADCKAEIERLTGEFVKSKRMGGKGKNRLMQADINRIARSIIGEYSSEISFYDLKDMLTGLYGFLANNEKNSWNYAYVVQTANDIAKSVIAQSFTDITPEEFADYKKALRGYRLIPNLEDVAKLEQMFGTFGAAYRQYGKKLNMRA